MARKSKKSKDEGIGDIPIESMIDVVFLLIIFFVVTAAIDKDIEDELVGLCDAPHGKALVKKNPKSVTINVRKDGTMNICQIQMTIEQISEQLKTTAVKWYPGHFADMPIIIRGDKDVQHGYIKKVLDAVTDTGLYKVRFMAIVSE